MVGLDRAVLGDDAARLDEVGGRLLVDDATLALDGLGETAGQTRRVYACAVRSEVADPRVGNVHALEHLLAGESHDVLLAPAPLAIVVDVGADARLLRLVARDAEDAALGEAAVDLLCRGALADPIDGLPRGALGATHGIIATRLGPLAVDACDAGADPAAVAARRAKARDLALDHAHAQRRVGIEQAVRGPETRHAGADDRDVAISVALQRRAGRDRARQGVPPEAAIANVALAEAHGVGTFATSAAEAAIIARSWSCRSVQGPPPTMLSSTPASRPLSVSTMRRPQYGVYWSE